MTYNKSLKENDDLKLQLVKLVREDGCSIAEAARILQLSERTCQCFFKQDMQWAEDWWKEFDKTKKQFVGWMEPAFFEKIQSAVEKQRISDDIGIPDKYKSPDASDEDKAVYEYCKKIIKDLHVSGGSCILHYGGIPPKDITGILKWDKKQLDSLDEDKPKKILIIADTQCKPTEDLTYMSWIGQYIAAKRPDVIVHIGDHYDFPSLSSYDKGKKSFEGRRLQADIDAGNKGLELLMQEFPEDYSPRLVFCMGNHEERLDRLANDMPELSGYVGTDRLPLEEMGWEVHPFLKPVEIGGIFFVHYLANPFTGKPYSGTAMNQLKTVGRSFVVGHKQCLDVAIRPTIDGKHQIGIINGACLTPDHKILTSDLRYIPLGEVGVGQEVVSFDENTQPNSHRRFKTGKVLAHKIEEDEVYEVKLSNGKVFKVTNDHKWLVKTGSTYLWKETNRLRIGTRVVKALDEWEVLTDYDSGWLSGIYDGEGTYGVRNSGNSTCCQLAVYQNEGLVLDKIKKVMFDNLAIEANTSIAKRKNCVEVKTKGGISSIVKLLGSLRPVRLLNKFKPEDLGRLSTTSSENPSVESITYLGNMDVVRIQIDEGTMIVEGFAHHNCYPFDEAYKGYQGNSHFRGITMLHEVKDGFGTPMFVSLDYLKNRYVDNIK